MKKIWIWKSTAYRNTKVHYIKTQTQINMLLNKNGIFQHQHTKMEDSCDLKFLKNLEMDGKNVKVGIKITLPDVEERNMNQLYRALFYYLKAKFESLTFGFVEEYNEAFVKEFMPYLIMDKAGKTVSDMILPKLNDALGYTPDKEQLYLSQLETKYEEEEPKEEIQTVEVVEDEA